MSPSATPEASLALGVDAGGTSTRALVLEHDGTCVGLGLAGSGNPTSAGAAQALASITDAAHQALRAADQDPSAVGSVVVAMAGMEALLPAADLARAIGSAGGADAVRKASDILAMYHSAAVEDTGCAVIAGTGSVGARIGGSRVVRVVGGCGWLLGDSGSGYAIGHQVARAVVGDLDGSGPATALTDLVLSEAGLVRTPGLEDGRPAVLRRLLDVLYARRPVELARYAPLAVDLAAAHPADPVARALVRAAHDEIAATIRAVREGWSGPLVLGGSVLRHGVLGHPDDWSPALAAALDGADPRVAHDGVTGAALLALRSAGAPVDAATFERVRATAAALRAPTPAGDGPAG